MKRYIGIFLGLILLLGTAGLALAQEGGQFFYDDFEITDRVNLGVRGGVVLPRMKSNYIFSFPDAAQHAVSIKGKNGWFAGGELTYDLGDYLGIGVEGYYEQYKVDANYPAQNIAGNAGTARNSMVFGKFILKYAFETENYVLVPYVAGAPGGIFPDFKESALVTNNNVRVGVSSGFAAKYSGGLDVYITDNIAINLEGAYLDVDIRTAVTAGNHGTAHNDVTNDAWLAGGGLKYLF